MGKIQTAKQDVLTQALAERLRALWDAYTRMDAGAHNEILTEDYRAVHPNGTVHPRRPSAEEIAAAPIENYWLTELQAWPIGEEAALTTYEAEVEVRSSGTTGQHKFAVGEVWAKRGGDWKCRYSHATMLK